MPLSQKPQPVPAFHSLKWRLPFLISCVIAAVLAMFLWAAYVRVESTLVRIARTRAQSTADQIGTLLDGNRIHQQLEQITHDQALRAYLEAPTDAGREAAKARLVRLAATGPRRTELWDDRGTLLLDAASTGPENVETKVLPPGPPPTAAGIGRLEGSDTLVYSDMVAEMKSQPAPGDAAAPRRLGFVRVRSTFVENPPGIFSRLVGPDAMIRIANRTGQTWTDFKGLVPAAPIDLSHQGVAEYRTPAGERHVGAVSLIPATPWAVWVDFPLESTLAPARIFLRTMGVVALIVIVVTAVLGSALAARIAKPVLEIGQAAAAVAAGDYSHRVTTKRTDEIGQLARTFNTMAVDIQRAEDALRRSEDSYRRLFASNPHPMWIYDLVTLRFLEVNDAATLHYGYSRAEFLGMTIKDIRPATELPALLANVARAGAAVERSGAWKHQKKNGEIIDVEISSHELTIDDRPARAVLANDVTERIKAKQALEEMNAELEARVLARTAQLESANQELESFSYSVSHDLRAPLRHVQGYVEMLTAATEGQLSGKVQQYLKTISAATVEMGDLIDDLLAFSRIARVQMSHGRVSLNAIVDDTIRGLEMATRGRQIDWRIDTLPAVTGDPSMVKQVYANLIGNAVKYTRTRDTATIEIGCVSEDDGQAVLFVRDNGAGFDMRYAHKLFGVFQRLHRSDEFEGTGIGLATVRRIVTRHGGRAWAEGEVDRGATFYFTLPLAAAAGAKELS